MDDLPESLASLAAILRRNVPGAETVTESRGDRARHLAATGAFEIVVSDDRLDRGDGRDVLAAARNARPDAGRVLLASGTGSDSPGLAEAAAPHAILAKPVAPSELVAVVLRLLAGTATEVPPVEPAKEAPPTFAQPLGALVAAEAPRLGHDVPKSEERV